MLIKLRKKIKAQSIVEYLLIFGGIVLAALYGVNKLAKRSRQTMDTGDLAFNKTDAKFAESMGLD